MILLGVLCSIVVGVSWAVLAPGSREIETDIGSMPVNPQDELRVTGEVWFTILLAALAVLTTVAWWRQAVLRGPGGLVLATSAAIGQTGVAWLVWRAVVAMRGFAGMKADGAEHLAAPVLTGSTPLWTAGVCATLTYIFLTILAPRSDLAAVGSARECEAGNRADESRLEE